MTFYVKAIKTKLIKSSFVIDRIDPHDLCFLINHTEYTSINFVFESINLTER